MAGFISERWPASNRNPGRNEIGIGGRIESEFAICRLNEVDPKAWLADVLARIADLPTSQMHELLPWELSRLRQVAKPADQQADPHQVQSLTGRLRACAKIARPSSYA